jgi:hypothetical protein
LGIIWAKCPAINQQINDYVCGLDKWIHVFIFMGFILFDAIRNHLTLKESME